MSFNKGIICFNIKENISLNSWISISNCSVLMAGSAVKGGKRGAVMRNVRFGNYVTPGPPPPMETVRSI